MLDFSVVIRCELITAVITGIRGDAAFFKCFDINYLLTLIKGF